MLNSNFQSAYTYILNIKKHILQQFQQLFSDNSINISSISFAPYLSYRNKFYSSFKSHNQLFAAVHFVSVCHRDKRNTADCQPNRYLLIKHKHIVSENRNIVNYFLSVYSKKTVITPNEYLKFNKVYVI